MNRAGLIQSATLISLLDSAESFFEKAQDSSPEFFRGSAQIDTGQIATGERLDQTQFYYQRLDPVDFHEAVRLAKRAAAVSESAARPDLHYLDRSRFVSDPNARHQHPDRSDLVDVAKCDQAA